MQRLFLIVISILIIVSMVGCGSNPANNETIANDGRSIYSVDIFRDADMVYDVNTRIVYIAQYTYNGNYVYTLYLSENGFPCRYVNGELVEVGK